MSVKGPGNTFDLSPKWARTLSLGIFHVVFIESLPFQQKKPIQISKLIFDTLLKGEGLYKYHMRNSERQSSSPLGVLIKCIAEGFNWFKFMGGFLHLKPTAGCQITTLIIEKKNCGKEGGLYLSHENFTTAELLPSWGLNQSYCPVL